MVKWMGFMSRRLLLISVASIAIWGCTQTNPHPQDPLEGLNRATFRFNRSFDNVVTKPIAYVYLKYLPQPFQSGIGNFFNNLREIPNVANDLLQFKFAYAAHDTSRFLINSTIGIFGLFDPASALGLEHRREDFGQTLYQWGYHNSSYLILPFIGPSTVRDAIGLGVDYYAFSIWPWIESDWKYAFLAVDFIDIRAGILRKESVLDVVAIDEYTFMRDAYFQHRKYLFNEVSEEETDDIYAEEFADEKSGSSKKEVRPAKKTKSAQKVSPSKEKEAEKTAEKTKETANAPLQKNHIENSTKAIEKETKENLKATKASKKSKEVVPE